MGLTGFAFTKASGLCCQYPRAKYHLQSLIPLDKTFSSDFDVHFRKRRSGKEDHTCLFNGTACFFWGLKVALVDFDLSYGMFL